jgi:hypothetical protein
VVVCTLPLVVLHLRRCSNSPGAILHLFVLCTCTIPFVAGSAWSKACQYRFDCFSPLVDERASLLDPSAPLMVLHVLISVPLRLAHTSSGLLRSTASSLCRVILLGITFRTLLPLPDQATASWCFLYASSHCGWWRIKPRCWVPLPRG